MGILKIELDIPEFNDKLELSMTLKRDGEKIMVVPSSKEPVIVKDLSLPKENQESKQKTSIPKKSNSGNMMNINMDF